MVEEKGDFPIPPAPEETLAHESECAHTKHKPILKRWSDALDSMSTVIGELVLCSLVSVLHGVMRVRLRRSFIIQTRASVPGFRHERGPSLAEDRPQQLITPS